MPFWFQRSRQVENDSDKKEKLCHCQSREHEMLFASVILFQISAYETQDGWLDMPDWVKDSENKTADVILGFVNKKD